MQECTAALASLTYAMKAQRALSETDIPVKIVKLDPSHAKRGCEYGIAYGCEHQKKVRDSLRAADISVRRYLKGGGEII